VSAIVCPQSNINVPPLLRDLSLKVPERIEKPYIGTGGGEARNTRKLQSISASDKKKQQVWIQKRGYVLLQIGCFLC